MNCIVFICLVPQYGIDLHELIELRRKIHSKAEGSFLEFQTQQLICDFLLKNGAQSQKINKCAETGVIYDILPERFTYNENSLLIGIRADMDALPMKENNSHLPYISTTEFAHMCGKNHN
jgi:metal-dependent amidase/aminoacylase/carboxypeptidase family protein